jgi:uncharacterized protein
VIRAAGRLLAGAAASLFLALPAGAADPAEPIPVPRLTGRVVDLAGALPPAERESITARLRAFEEEKGAQVAVLLVPSLGTETIEEFATRVTDEWKLGRAGVDDGVLFVVAMRERRMRIQTGRGVQGVLTDALSKRIIAERVAPRFKAGDYAGGIHDGVGAILKAIEGEALPAPSRQSAPKADASGDDHFVMLAYVLVPVAGLILRGLLGRFLGAAVTGGVTGFVAGFVLGSVVLGGIAAVVAFLFVLFMGRAGFHSGGGSWSSDGGGGSSGGGGFSGGGGSFDGGGASGDW